MFLIVLKLCRPKKKKHAELVTVSHMRYLLPCCGPAGAEAHSCDLVGPAVSDGVALVGTRELTDSLSKSHTATLKIKSYPLKRFVQRQNIF